MARKKTRALHPVMRKLINDENKFILKRLAEPAHAEGCTINQMKDLIQAKFGYATTSVPDRLKALMEEGKVHRVKSPKQGTAFIYRIGAEPAKEPDELELPFDAPPAPTTEPPLAQDEMLSLLFNMDKTMTANLAKQERELELVRNMIIRICTEFGIDVS